MMKEAAGEANMTVITIVLIGVVAAAGAVFIPRLMDNMRARSCCTEFGGTWNKDTKECEGSALNGGQPCGLTYLKQSPSCQ